MKASRVHFYVESIHSVGGVTTWSFQAAMSLTKELDGRVVTVSRPRDDTAYAHLFPGPTISFSLEPRKTFNANSGKEANDLPLAPPDVSGSRRAAPEASAPSSADAETRENDDDPRVGAEMKGSAWGISSRPTDPTESMTPTAATEPIQPSDPIEPITPTAYSVTTPGSARKPNPTIPTKPSKPTKPTVATKSTLPTKPTLFGPYLPGSWAELDDFVRGHIAGTGVFIPNYLEAGYRHAALSVIQGFPSRCIGICHTDLELYYRLLVQYEPIVQTFIAVSRKCESSLRTLFPHRIGDIHLLPYGVTRPTLAPRERQGGTIKLLYSGRLVNDQKRIMDLVELGKILAANSCDYEFDFVGVGADRDDLITAVKPIKNISVFDGVTQSQMSKIYARYDVLVLASDSEGLSISMLEGMAHGVIPVVTRVSGSEDIIIDGENGFLCEVGDMLDMAQRISQLANVPELLDRMSKNAYRTIRGDYLLPNHLRHFRELVQLTLEKPVIQRQVAEVCLERSIHQRYNRVWQKPGDGAHKGASPRWLA